MAGIEGTRATKVGVDHGAAIKIARGDYDFAVDGGAQGDIDLMGVAGLPADAIVLGGLVEVTAALTSAGAATVALKAEGVGDVIAAAAVSGAPWSTVGRKSVIPDMSGANSLKTTADRDITMTIATADLTAGAFKAVLFYLEPLPAS